MSYVATRYSSIAPDSKILSSTPSVVLSVMAGIRPLGLISVNHGSFCSFLNISIGTSCMVCQVRHSAGRRKNCHVSTLYSSPSSSRAMWIFNPLGVPSLYAVILVLVVILNDAGSLARFRASRCGGIFVHWEVSTRIPECQNYEYKYFKTSYVLLNNVSKKWSKSPQNVCLQSDKLDGHTVRYASSINNGRAGRQEPGRARPQSLAMN